MSEAEIEAVQIDLVRASERDVSREVDDLTVEDRGVIERQRRAVKSCQPRMRAR